MQGAAKKLVFENGAVFSGRGFGAAGDAVCEVVFNTGMVGYQEVFTDASYHRQMVCMTYPLIGNYGMAADDDEGRAPRLGGLIVREYTDSLANFRAAKTLGEAMEEHGVPGIAGVDTRRLARMIRSFGSMRAALCDAAVPEAEALARIAAAPPPENQIAAVSCKKRWFARAARAKRSVAVIDCGVKLGIIQALVARGCNVAVLPHDTPAAEVLALGPDGVLLSNGPGDPAAAKEVIALAAQLIGKLPVFGICMGHQVAALACGAKTFKLKFGHRGGNHPVQELASGKVAVTSQNHSYAVDESSLAGTGLAVSHVNLLDGTVEGLADEARMLFTVQFHPESRPGPSDSVGLFDGFVGRMEGRRGLGG